jgi:hypothetical protein
VYPKYDPLTTLGVAMDEPDHQTAFAWTHSAGADDAAKKPQRVRPPKRAEPSVPISQHGAAVPPPDPATSRTELPPDAELWDVADAARFLKMSASWVYKRVEKGDLPCLRVHGWALRFLPAQLRAWATTQQARRRPRRATTSVR